MLKIILHSMLMCCFFMINQYAYAGCTPCGTSGEVRSSTECYRCTHNGKSLCCVKGKGCNTKDSSNCH